MVHLRSSWSKLILSLDSRVPLTGSRLSWKICCCESILPIVLALVTNQICQRPSGLKVSHWRVGKLASECPYVVLIRWRYGWLIRLYSYKIVYLFNLARFLLVWFMLPVSGKLVVLAVSTANIALAEWKKSRFQIGLLLHVSGFKVNRLFICQPNHVTKDTQSALKRIQPVRVVYHELYHVLYHMARCSFAVHPPQFARRHIVSSFLISLFIVYAMEMREHELYLRSLC